MLDVVVGFFAAAGGLCLLWALFGRWLLPVDCSGVTVWFVKGDGRQLERQVQSFCWLQNSGFMDGTLLLCDCGLSAEGVQAAIVLTKRFPCVHICTQDSLIDELKLGVEHDRT